MSRKSFAILFILTRYGQGVNCPTYSNPFLYSLDDKYSVFESVIPSKDGHLLIGGSCYIQSNYNPCIIELSEPPFIQYKRAFIFYLNNLRNTYSIKMLSQPSSDRFRVTFEDPQATVTLDWDQKEYIMYRFYTSMKGVDNWEIKGAHMLSTRGYFLLTDGSTIFHLVELSYLSKQILREVQLSTTDFVTQDLFQTGIWNQFEDRFEFYSITNSDVFSFWQVDFTSFEVTKHSSIQVSGGIGKRLMFSYGGEGYRGFCTQGASNTMIFGHVNFDHFHYHSQSDQTCAGVDSFKHKLFWLGRYQSGSVTKAFLYYYEIDGSMSHANQFLLPAYTHDSLRLEGLIVHKSKALVIGGTQRINSSDMGQVFGFLHEGNGEGCVQTETYMRGDLSFLTEPTAQTIALEDLYSFPDSSNFRVQVKDDGIVFKKAEDFGSRVDKQNLFCSVTEIDSPGSNTVVDVEYGDRIDLTLSDYKYSNNYCALEDLQFSYQLSGGGTFDASDVEFDDETGSFYINSYDGSFDSGTSKQVTLTLDDGNFTNNDETITFNFQDNQTPNFGSAQNSYTFYQDRFEWLILDYKDPDPIDTVTASTIAFQLNSSPVSITSSNYWFHQNNEHFFRVFSDPSNTSEPSTNFQMQLVIEDDAASYPSSSPAQNNKNIAISLKKRNQRPVITFTRSYTLFCLLDPCYSFQTEQSEPDSDSLTFSTGHLYSDNSNTCTTAVTNSGTYQVDLLESCLGQTQVNQEIIFGKFEDDNSVGDPTGRKAVYFYIAVAFAVSTSNTNNLSSQTDFDLSFPAQDSTNTHSFLLQTIQPCSTGYDFSHLKYFHGEVEVTGSDIPSSFSHNAALSRLDFFDVSNRHWGNWGVALPCQAGTSPNDYSAWTMFNIRVIPVNQQPICDTLNVSFNGDAAVSVDLDSMDPDYLTVTTNEVLTIQLVIEDVDDVHFTSQAATQDHLPLPSFVTYDQATFTLTIDPENCYDGWTSSSEKSERTLEIKVLFADTNLSEASNGALSNSIQFEVIIKTMNTAPTLNPFDVTYYILRTETLSFTLDSGADEDYYDLLEYNCYCSSCRDNINPSFMVFDKNILTLNAQEDNSEVGYYEFTCQVTDNNSCGASEGTQTTSQTLIVEFQGVNRQPFWSQSFKEFSVNLYEQKSLGLPNFFDADSEDLHTLSIIQADGQKVPTWIQIQSDSLSVFCEDTFEVATHQFLVTVLDQNEAGSYNGKLQDDILIELTIKAVNLPPQFDQEPTSFELEILETYTILLSVSDPDIQDTLLITGSINGAELPSFITLEGITIKVHPFQPEEVGIYEVTLVVFDDDTIGSGVIKSAEATFTIEVLEPIASKTAIEDIFPGVQQYFVTDKASEVSPQLKLSKISEEGQIEISFSQEMLIPLDLTLIDNSVLKFTFEHSYSVLDSETEISNWEVTSMDSHKMLIQVYFEHSEYISAFSVSLAFNSSVKRHN